MKRRQFLQHATLAAAASVMPVRAFGIPPSVRSLGLSEPREYTDADLQALVTRAIDAARSAGASYADAHVTVLRGQLPGRNESEDRAIGVRALVDDYWGFVASSVWTADESARLARGAVAQAKAHRRGRTRAVDLAPGSIVHDGEWIQPVKYDPFDIPVTEKLDVMNSIVDYASSYQVGLAARGTMSFTREKKISATSDNASWTQTTYRSQAAFTLFYRDEYHRRLGPGSAVRDLGPAGQGWELVSESDLIDTMPRLIAAAEQSRHVTSLDVGRYDIVFSAEAMATLVDQTLGAATELDRALGYEANASGTSYFNDPLEMLGTRSVGSQLVTVTANRSIPAGLATRKWDDEGVIPEDFTIIKDGILVDYQTTREQAAWLADYYRKSGRTVRSHGCANASSAMAITMQHAPNLALVPSAQDTSFDDLVASTPKGIAMMSLRVAMDQQLLNGIGYGAIREIKNGKLGRYVEGGALVFRTPEVWKNLIGIGGRKSFDWYPALRGKGEPWQGTWHTVGAVPAKIKQLSIIDPVRKA